MNNQRRTVLKSGSGAALLGMLAAAGLITPGMALADWNKAAFDAKRRRVALSLAGDFGAHLCEGFDHALHRALRERFIADKAGGERLCGEDAGHEAHRGA